MASQEVLTALESLHREIEKLEPAIKHVETAQQVTQTVKAIPQKHVELMQEVKSNDAKHKDELRNRFAKELEMVGKIRTQIKFKFVSEWTRKTSKNPIRSTIPSLKKLPFGRSQMASACRQ